MNGLVREILHCDLNNFYATVACRDDPSLRGKAVAVGGSKEERHGIILAKNEIAKQFGVSTGEAIWQAQQKCPSLIVVPPDFKRYTYFSQQVRRIYERYTDLVEPFGIDECWLDVTGSRRLFGDGVTIADRIRQEITAEQGLTASVGVSFNKIFAKLGSDLKKPNATNVIPYDRFREIVWPLEVNRLLGVGPATERKLHSLAIFTVGDLANADFEAVRLRLGKNGELLHRFANGEENSAVLKTDFKYRPQSIGRSVTCPKDLLNFDEVYRVFLRLSEEVARELRREDMEAHSIAVHIRDNRLQVREFMTGVDFPVQSAKVLADEGIKLLKRSYGFEYPLRSVGIRAINLRDYSPEFQLSFFDDRMRLIKQDMLERSMDKVRDRYGDGAVVRASLLNDFKAFRDQSPSTLGRTRLSL
ncbi:MAG: DNA polymerase IV [Clostridia bacterium]|nr:DNA polymerase IV [Clostridia bacterium]